VSAAKKRAAGRRPARKRATARKVKSKRVAKSKASAAKRPKGAKRAPKKSVSKSGKRPAAPRAAKKPSATPAAAKKSVTAPATAKRPKLAIVRKPAPRPVAPAPVAPPEPEAFAGAKANASAKELVLFELVRARVAVHAAIQGLTARSADQPTAPGKWTSREMVLHLAYWDREMQAALEDCYQHNRKPPQTHEDVLRLNPVGVAELSHHDWEAAKRLLQNQRERLLEQFQSIPEEPAEVWSKEHAVGWLARFMARHDRHHADKLKAAREGRGE
jgi:hypothetical protein